MGELECFEVFGIFWDSLLFSGDVVELEQLWCEVVVLCE